MRENRILITAPTASVIPLSEVKQALGVSDTSQDLMISAALAAAVSSLDAASGGWLARALRPQTWELRLPEFPPYCEDEEIRLPHPPLISVTSIKYDDSSGTEQTLVENTDYIVLGVGGNSFGSVRPVYNGSWPSARYISDSVRIRYVCGYAEGDNSPPTDDDMPAAIKQGVVLMVRSIMSSAAQNLFLSSDKVDGVGEKRYVVSSDGFKVMQQTAQALLRQFEVITV
jgi:uncharacterized phiE125 gp8 family phage protein